MNTKPFFFLCLLCALLLIISAVATEPSIDETQASETEESKTDIGLDGWGGYGPGGGWGYGGDWGRGGYGGGWGRGGPGGGWGRGGRGGGHGGRD